MEESIIYLPTQCEDRIQICRVVYDAFFLDIEYLLKEKKRYAITYLLDTEFEDYFYNRKVNVKFNVDSNHKVINYDKI